MNQGELPLPICKAAIVCERVIQDVVTGMYSLIGICDEIYFQSFPAQLPPFCIFLTLDDGIGEYQLAAEVRDGEDRLLADSPTVAVDFRSQERGFRYYV